MCSIIVIERYSTRNPCEIHTNHIVKGEMVRIQWSSTSISPSRTIWCHTVESRDQSNTRSAQWRDEISKDWFRPFHQHTFAVIHKLSMRSMVYRCRTKTVPVRTNVRSWCSIDSYQTLEQLNLLPRNKASKIMKVQRAFSELEDRTNGDKVKSCSLKAMVRVLTICRWSNYQYYFTSLDHFIVLLEAWVDGTCRRIGKPGFFALFHHDLFETSICIFSCQSSSVVHEVRDLNLKRSGLSSWNWSLWCW